MNRTMAMLQDEVELEGLFRREFPFDVIEAVSTGVRGGDLLEAVEELAA